MTDTKYDAGFAAGVEAAARAAGECARQIRALSPGDGWCRDMDAAPNDGRDLLLYQEGWAINPVIVGRCSGGTWLSDCFEIDEPGQRPTAWRHLPEPPR